MMDVMVLLSCVTARIPRDTFRATDEAPDPRNFLKTRLNLVDSEPLIYNYPEEHGF